MEVEVKVVGIFDGVMVTVASTVTLAPGARVKHALARLLEDGTIDRKLYKQIKNPKPPCFVVLNDEKQDRRAVKLPVKDGDSVAVMQIMAGG